MHSAWATDLRLAIRQLWKKPAFTCVAAGTLALGIGAATALFSVVHGVLISPYPYANPDGIWTPGISAASGAQRLRPFRHDAFEELRHLPAFSDVMATAPGSRLLTGTFAPETVTTIQVTGNAFAFLGVAPALGRGLQPSDISSTGEALPVAVLSFRRWQQAFGGATDVLGRTLRLDDVDHTIVGVMPPRFGWWTSDGVWVPLARTAPDQQVFPIARLDAGVTAATAEQQWQALVPALAAAHPQAFPRDDLRGILTNYMDITVASGPMQRSLRLLFGAVAFLLLIACANVANLQLARASGRGREIAVRLSLGAGRGQIVRQLLTESLALALLGGIAGLVCAYAIIQVMVHLMPTFFVPNEARIELNTVALAFCVAVSICTGLLFGLVPALQTSTPNLVRELKDEARGTSGTRGGATRSALVVAEVAVSVVLLASAGVTARSFAALQQLDLGFDPAQVLAVGLPLPPRTYDTLEARNRFARELVERVRALPGVEAVTIGNGGLPFGGPQSDYTIDGQPGPDGRRLRLHLAGEDYLGVLRVPLRQGRMLTDREVAAGDGVAVINEAAAALWPDGVDPVGRQLRLELLESTGNATVLTREGTSPFVTVVGVMADIRNDGLQRESQPTVVVPYTIVAPPQRTLAVRAAGPLPPLISALRAQVLELDAAQPLSTPFTFEEIVDSETAQPRFTMALFSAFAALGLVLAMAGLYSVLSYLVATRTREIGIRMALGAEPRHILRLVGHAGLRLVLIGLIAGMAGSLGLGRLLASQLDLFETSTHDPVVFAFAGTALGLAALAACLIPARRAASVPPTVAMR